ncbi:RING finger protein 227 [Syngnathoides biaculeatus]|uniref:RING finger protein 227 n=1 Tax=Syngnathoides biaculeatus TaxID=300417 RepID=UPI002ADE59FD|nr:RING finger protein 227 [Syngnathoides biaculeatus]
MVLCGEGDCGVCLLAFSRTERVPRLLHCRHTFCQACLESMAAPLSAGGVGSPLSVRCPLCRRVTCLGRGLGPREALRVDGERWERIPSDREDQDRVEASPRAERNSSRNKLKFRSFFRKFTLTKRPRERIVTTSNVEMKSWRRLSSQETL